tara:strand:+ start:793 stop:1170 length:378 start_codon:yes stop_codon:yes gene_type:complete
MIETYPRNKNYRKTPIEYDVNVYVLEDYDFDTKQSYWNTEQWYLHVYDYNKGDHKEISMPFLLTAEESFAMNFVNAGDIDEGLDGWMDLYHLRTYYKDQMSDRILRYLESFPKYREDIRPRTIYI